jgi:hypothetical protein
MSATSATFDQPSRRGLDGAIRSLDKLFTRAKITKCRSGLARSTLPPRQPSRARPAAVFNSARRPRMESAPQTATAPNQLNRTYGIRADIAVNERPEDPAEPQGGATPWTIH